MSGVLKSIGRVFKKVLKTVKKIALPVLAIGAVVLTGGAALGALPALGTTLGSLGLGATATGVLTAAAQGATIGALGSAVTGGNIIKGATSGFLAGGLTGGIGAIAGGAGGAASAAGSASGTIAPTAGAQLTSTFGNQLVGALPNVASSAALPSTFGNSLISSLPNVGGGIGSVASGGLGAAASLGPVLNTTMPTGGVPAGGGGIGGIFKGMDPLMKGQLISGIGQGLLANEQIKAQRRAQREERDRIEASYANIGDSLFRAGDPGNRGQDPNTRFNAPVYGKVNYDPQTGRIIPRGA